MRIVFFGTPSFALASLQILIDQPEFEVVGVVSQPDRPQGRGRKLVATPVKLLAEAHGIPICQPERLRKSPETLQQLGDWRADVFVVVAYGQILSQQVLDMPHLGCVNVHGSLLPAYRGAAPIQWAIAQGETRTGITTMLMDAGMDTGAMLLKAEVEIGSEQTGAELAEVLADLGARLLVDTLRQWGSLTPIPQDEQLASYAPLLKPKDFELDWQRSAQTLHNQIRAFSPDCFTTLQGERLKIIRSHCGQSPLMSPHPSLPVGSIVQLVKNQGFRVQTGSHPLLITEVQPANKKAQSAWDFVNGSRLQVGQILGV
ncbi:MAG: methionyl-tRNA formyltransferase [Cyanobacteriota bacterium]|nr:methionyl-tRNA formyltransferase [Cyanobacteriota bacterium]